MEELQSRHRKEQRDLRARITQKKKQASKKTRKGVNEECDKLEADLKERQRAELAELNGDGPDIATNDTPLSEELEDLILTTNGHDEENDLKDAGEKHDDDVATNGLSHPSTKPQAQPKKPNRQKARLARRAAEQEELAQQAAEEAKNLPDLKQQERERMLASMQERGLHEKEIRADGHCLYSAVADQLGQLEMPLSIDGSDDAAESSEAAYQTVRGVAADYIERHADDFEPFLEEPLAAYLAKIRNTGEWGGQLELLALAKSYAVDIHVLQDFGRVEKIESGIAAVDGGDGEKAMWLAYYKHGFGLGEHYNSLRRGP